MNPRNSFLGTGWGFPVSFQKKKENCTVRLVDDIDDIKESLSILFSTRPGERIMRPDFGAALDDLLFEPINEGLKNFIIDRIRKSILYYEARIELEEVSIDDSDSRGGRVSVSLTFSVRRTNSRFNYVFDYYKNEATIVPL